MRGSGVNHMQVDYAGPQGGMLAMAFAAGWAVATALWMAVAGTIWKLFLEPRIKALEAVNEDARRRIEQLETILMIHPPAMAAQRIQAATSEIRVDIAEIKGGKGAV